MTEILSQEEIDALLSAGIGGLQEEKEAPPPKAKKAPSPKTPAMQAAAYPQPQPPASPKKQLRPSARVPDNVRVQPAEFVSFDTEELPSDSTNLEIILNLDLEVRVELGKTTKTVKDILDMGSGSVVELKKLNGEPVDLLVNKKNFAKGEMIVIGENFGVRVTDIISINEIIEALR